MKKIIVSLLVLSVVACTNTIKKENISLKGRHYITKNSNIPVDGLLKEKVDGKNIKIKIENGYVVSKESDNILYPFKNFRLNEKVEVKKNKFLYFENGFLQRIVEDEDDISFYYGIPEYIKNKELYSKLPNDNNLYFEIFDNGILSGRMYKTDNLNINENYTYYGSINELSIHIEDYTKTYRFYDSGELIGQLKSCKILKNGSLEGLQFEFDGRSYTLSNYKNNILISKKVYNIKGILIHHYDYNSDFTYYYEYFPDNNQIKTVGFYNNEGLRTGRWVFFYPDGNTKEYRKYIDNNLAYFNTYYENGLKKTTGTIDVDNNIYKGTIKYYENNGNLSYTEIYDNSGILIDRKENLR
jgi:hypothetical protein